MHLNGACFTLLYLLLCAQCICSISNKLQAFHSAFAEARDDLQKLRAIDADKQMHRRQSIDDMWANFQNDGDDAAALVGNDMELTTDSSVDDTCGGGGGGGGGGKCGGGSKVRKNINMHGFSEIDKVKERYKQLNIKPVYFMSDNGKEDFETPKAKVKSKNNNYNYYNPLSELSSGEDPLQLLQGYDNFDESLRNSRHNYLATKSHASTNGGSISDGIGEAHFEREGDRDMNFDGNFAMTSKLTSDQQQSKNDLSHEADYKLSKLEQDAAEKRKCNNWNYNKRNAYVPKKRSGGAGFNPMNEIKLKTSHRMMRKGFGASLPSYALEDTRRQLHVNDLVKHMEAEGTRPTRNKMNYDLMQLDRMIQLDDMNLNNPDRNYRYKRLEAPDSNGIVVEVGFSTADINRMAAHRQRAAEFDRYRRISDERLQQRDQEIQGALQDLQQRLKENADVIVALVNSNDNSFAQDKFQMQRSVCALNRQKAKRQEFLNANTNANGNLYDNMRREDLTPEQAYKLRRRARRLRTSQLREGNRYDDGVDFRSRAHFRTRRAIHANANSSCAEAKLLKRHKRSSECDMPVQSKEDFDTLELNEDELGKRFRRSLPQTAPSTVSTSIDNSTHMIHKRSASNLDDDLDDNSINQMDNIAAGIINSPSGSSSSSIEHSSANAVRDDELVKNKKNVADRNDYNFGISARSMAKQQYDNLSQKDTELAKMANIKFDNLWIPPLMSFSSHKTHKTLKDKAKIQQNNNDIHKAKVAKNHNNNNNNNNKLEKLQSNIVDNGESTNPKNIDNAENNPNHHKSNKQVDKNLIVALREELLNCSTFSKLENFLNNIKNPLTQLLNQSTVSSSPQNNAENNSNSDSGDSTHEKVNMDSKPTNVSNDTDSTTTPTVSDSTPSPSTCNEASNTNDQSTDPVKLNITISASLMSDPDNKHFTGNGSLNVEPGLNEERERRGINYAKMLGYRQKRRNKQNGKSKNSFNDLVNGKLSANVVRSIFGLVKSCPKLKVLWPSLKRNQANVNEQFKTVNSEDYNNKNLMMQQHRKQMLHKTMSEIGKVLEQNVPLSEGDGGNGACIFLRPDIKEFYELILESHTQADKFRDKRDNCPSCANDFGQKDDDGESMNEEKLDEKRRIVKKLLRQYEELPLIDQEQVTDIRDDLLNDLMYLRKLTDTHEAQQERVKRELQRRELESISCNSEVWKSLEQKFSPEYLKLVKMAEMFENAGATDVEQTL